MTNVEIAAVFDEIADLLEFQGANAFRIRAYRNAARTLHDLPQSIAELVYNPNRSLTEIEGIGKDLAEKITTLVETGSLPMREELLKEIPESVLAILRVPGLGPKRASTLFRELKVTTLDELRAACTAHRVQDLKGFGAKTEESILAGLDIATEADQRVLWAEADENVQAILAHMRQGNFVRKIEAAGSYRRGRDTVGDLDFLAVADDPAAAMDRLAAYAGAGQSLVRGDTKMSLRLTAGLQIDLRVVAEESFGAALQYFTGSKDHNIIVRGRAKDRGLKINEYGVFRGDERIAGATEEDVYATLDLPCFPPELREARREFQWADQGKLPKLIQQTDIRGDLHAHTTESDGIATLEEMVAAAQESGLEYLAITDHSKRVSMANGLDGKRLRKQWAEIDQLNAKLSGFTVLKGVECDILEKGGMDLADDVLAEADWVVASVHYGQNQSREEITRRVIDAIKNPHVSVIGHPTGRMLRRRKPYEIDLPAVMQAAADYGKMLELNSHPIRLDLDDVGCAVAKGFGVKIVISTDAHRVEGLRVMRYGILQGCRAGLEKADVANTRHWPDLKKLLG